MAAVPHSQHEHLHAEFVLVGELCPVSQSRTVPPSVKNCLLEQQLALNWLISRDGIEHVRSLRCGLWGK
jgi:hypothetical protein